MTYPEHIDGEQWRETPIEGIYASNKGRVFLSSCEVFRWKDKPRVEFRGDSHDVRVLASVAWGRHHSIRGEEWKRTRIPGVHASNKGRVFVEERIVPNQHGHRIVPARVIVAAERNQKVNGSVNYNIIPLGGERINIGHLIAETWLGARPCPNLVVRHLDGDKLNFNADNIAWGMRRSNKQSGEMRLFDSNGRRLTPNMDRSRTM